MKPLINKSYKLEKFPGKSGWTYIKIPEVPPDRSKPFGWVKVKGTIDRCAISKCRLMPMGNGLLFLPVKAEIRKLIGKGDGDMVKVVLYPDADPLDIPEDFLQCLRDEPKALVFFKTLPETEQSSYINWIYDAKKIETRIDRMAKAINKLERGLKRYQPST